MQREQSEQASPLRKRSKSKHNKQGTASKAQPASTASTTQQSTASRAQQATHSKRRTASISCWRCMCHPMARSACTVSYDVEMSDRKQTKGSNMFNRESIYLPNHPHHHLHTHIYTIVIAIRVHLINNIWSWQVV